MPNFPFFRPQKSLFSSVFTAAKSKFQRPFPLLEAAVNSQVSLFVLAAIDAPANAVLPNLHILKTGLATTQICIAFLLIPSRVSPLQLALRLCPFRVRGCGYEGPGLGLLGWFQV